MGYIKGKAPNDNTKEQKSKNKTINSVSDLNREDIKYLKDVFSVSTIINAEDHLSRGLTMYVFQSILNAVIKTKEANLVDTYVFICMSITEDEDSKNRKENTLHVALKISEGSGTDPYTCKIISYGNNEFGKEIGEFALDLKPFTRDEVLKYYRVSDNYDEMISKETNISKDVYSYCIISSIVSYLISSIRFLVYNRTHKPFITSSYTSKFGPDEGYNKLKTMTKAICKNEVDIADEISTMGSYVYSALDSYFIITAILSSSRMFAYMTKFNYNKREQLVLFLDEIVNPAYRDEEISTKIYGRSGVANRMCEGILKANNGEPYIVSYNCNTPLLNNHNGFDIYAYNNRSDKTVYFEIFITNSAIDMVIDKISVSIPNDKKTIRRSLESLLLFMEINNFSKGSLFGISPGDVPYYIRMRDNYLPEITDKEAKEDYDTLFSSVSKLIKNVIEDGNYR